MLVVFSHHVFLYRYSNFIMFKYDSIRIWRQITIRWKTYKVLRATVEWFFCSINDSFYDDGHISHHDKKCLLTSERRRAALVIRRWFFRLTKWHPFIGRGSEPPTLAERECDRLQSSYLKQHAGNQPIYTIDVDASLWCNLTVRSRLTLTKPLTSIVIGCEYV